MQRTVVARKLSTPIQDMRIPRRLLKDTEVEAQYGISRFTLRADRVRARKFKFIKIGRSVFYRVEDIETILDSYVVSGAIG